MERIDRVTLGQLEACLRRFDEVRSGLKVLPSGTSLLRPLADSALEMVDCYRSDAADFIGSGDYVTAFAAINYSHAWIGCFTRYGLFDSDPGDELYRLSFPGSDESGQITDEKIGKYLDITSRARKKLDIAPPARSFDRRLAFEFLEASESFFKEAVEHRNGYDYVKAFASVNYSHAWLDAGARIGLFDVKGDDVLFTLYE